MDIKDLVKGVLGDVPVTLSTFDPRNQYVSAISPLDIISGENISVWAGPPTAELALRNSKYLRPVGTATVLNVSTIKQWFPVSEFGYQYFYHIPGKVQYSVSIQKILSGSGDQFSDFYKWLQFIWQDKNFTNKIWVENPSISLEHSQNNDGINKFGLPNFVGSVGVQNHGSDLFHMPFGIALFQFDQTGSIVKQQYLENCKIGPSNSAHGANSPITEGSNQINVTRVCSLLVQLQPPRKIEYNLTNFSENPTRNS
jgi:hypothetical protein